MFSKKFLFVVGFVVLFGFGAVAEEIEVPFCECVDASVDCADTAALDGLVQTLLGLADVCLNGCSDECQASFYPLHAYHELCPGFGAEAGELYHDLSLFCQVCDPGHLGSAIDRPECPSVDCSDVADQGELVALLTSQDCAGNCFTNSDCTDAWIKLSAYHETCPEENLSVDLVKDYHDIEETCPPECAPPTMGAPLGEVDCGVLSVITVDDHDHEDHDDEHDEHDHDDEKSPMDEHDEHDHDEHDHDDHDEHDHDDEKSPMAEHDDHDEHDHDDHDDDKSVFMGAMSP